MQTECKVSKWKSKNYVIAQWQLDAHRKSFPQKEQVLKHLVNQKHVSSRRSKSLQAVETKVHLFAIRIIIISSDSYLSGT